MALKRTSVFILLFWPEDSSRWVDEKWMHRIMSRHVDETPRFSVKALVWILISILMGLAIGRLF